MRREDPKRNRGQKGIERKTIAIVAKKADTLGLVSFTEKFWERYGAFVLPNTAQGDRFEPNRLEVK
jgi:hypothetical protein